MNVHPDRITVLNEAPHNVDGRYVLYWMSAAQRVTDNHALEYAIAEANRRSLPVLVCFGYIDAYPHANERHLTFMLEGLSGVAADLRHLGVAFLVERRTPPELVRRVASQAALVVCDMGYLRLERRWRTDLADALPVRLVEVETNAVVPVRIASDKQEYAARTIRPKLRRLIDTYLDGTTGTRPEKGFDVEMERSIQGEWADPDDLRNELPRSATVPRSERFTGGEAAAAHRLDAFLTEGLSGYATDRNDPADPSASELSPYLHFGQISPVTITNAIMESAVSADADAFVEQLVVRRELALNFVTFQPEYDSYEAISDWAKRTLAAHSSDPRTHLVDEAALENADTHDRYWNAAMIEMTSTGYMHNYMRMYWGKKILEWSVSPEAAYETTLRLNNTYFIDGRDPVSYASVAWIYGVHDRPWPERPIYGTVRSMTAGGLKRKFDIDAYVARTMVLG